MKIAFLIRQLDVGGAEKQLLLLVHQLKERGVHCRVLSMYGNGTLWSAFAELLGDDLVCLDKGGRWDITKFLARLYREVRDYNPDFLHSYMSGANEIATVIGSLTKTKVIWGIRVSDLDNRRYIWSVSLLFRVGAILSSMPSAIIANSFRGREVHEGAGYRNNVFEVVPNGFDGGHYDRCESAGWDFRSRLGVSKADFLLVVAARIDPVKGHANVIRALSLMKGSKGFVVFIGDGSAAIKAQLVQLAEQLNVKNHVQFLPAVKDMIPVYSAADVVCIPSDTEGFSNVLAEAMLCRCVCISTKVGDAEQIIGENGFLVPPKNPQALAEAFDQVVGLTALEREGIGAEARVRILKEFSPSALAERTLSLLERVGD